MIDWKKISISPNSTILDAIKVIDQGGVQIALVISSDQKLLGTLTDGDVRRAILKGIPTSHHVSEIMNKKPFVLVGKKDKDSLISIMKEKSINQIPLVSEQGEILSLELLEELLQVTEIKPNHVVIMAGGMGSRLLPLTEDTPKPLLEVGNRPLLETTLRHLISEGFRKFYFSINYRGEMIEKHFGDGSKWGVEINYLKEKEKLGTAGSLGLLPEAPQEPVVVLNGDLLTKVSFSRMLNFHQNQLSEATMGVRDYEVQVPYGVVSLKGDEIQSIDEKPIHKFFVNAGLYVISPSAISMIQKNVRIEMTNVFQNLIAQKRKTSVYPVKEYWLDIGRLDDYHRANGEFARFFQEE